LCLVQDPQIEIQAQTVTQSNEPTLDQQDEVKAEVCSEELYETIMLNTKATLHKNTCNSNQSIVHINTPDLTKTSFSSHICCVIDVSGSMAVEAKCKNEHGLETKTGLSVLDVVKFATLVISKSLESKDKLSIVTYSTNAKTVLEPTCMTEAGKKKVETLLTSIKPQNMTNLWDGMKMAINLAHDVGQDYINSIFVLTDGIPNVHPPLGYARSLARLLQKLPLFGTLSTFGFGYQLDSPLLVQIAKDGGGYFSFIPDAGFVGTCFINAVANSRCAFGITPMLRIGADLSIEEIKSLSKYHNIEKKGDDMCIKINQMRYGAPIDIFINHGQTDGDMDIDLVFKVVGGRDLKIPVRKIDTVDEISDMFHHIRDGFIEKGFRVTSSLYRRTNMNAFTPPVEATSFRDKSDEIDALCKDMEGQATEAVSSAEYYDESWGRHYLFSLIGAHLHQFCNNFKDPGVQTYGKGSLFNTLQEELNDIFEKIPAPEPTIIRRYGNTNSTTSNNPSMSRTFNNRNAVCVHGKTKVIVKSQKWDNHNQDDSFTESVPISNVKKGDLLLTEDKSFARVQCLVETVTDTPLDLVQINELQITPYHPLKLGSNLSWEFPINCKEGKLIKSDSHSVYNLILERKDRHKPVMMEKGIACITLGHGINEDATLKHDYFGTDRIVQDLQRFRSGWTLGHVILQEENVKRTNLNGDICCISQSPIETVNVSKQLCAV
jgi:Mg-chelatase subunit ChlD